MKSLPIGKWQSIQFLQERTRRRFLPIATGSIVQTENFVRWPPAHQLVNRVIRFAAQDVIDARLPQHAMKYVTHDRAINRDGNIWRHRLNLVADGEIPVKTRYRGPDHKQRAYG